jgi:glycosyltransferase involved in cell wall biosynthesis
MNDFPRILFVTPVAFNCISGGGITFSNLFRGWPKSALATVHNDPEPTLDDVCSHYYVLGEAELDLAPPFNYLRRKYQAPTALVGAPISDRVSGYSFGLASRLKKLSFRVFGGSYPERAELTFELERWISEFQPEILYTILGSNGMMDLVEKIRCRFGLRLVVHIMDDWVSSCHRKGLLARGQRTLMLKHVNHFMHVATRCLAISPAMCDAYAYRYGRKFTAFQNTVEVSHLSPCLRSPLHVGTPADFLYVGSIFANAQLESLLDCCRAVARLNREGLASTLTIATQSEHAVRLRERLVLDSSIKIELPIDDDAAFFRRIAAADVLLLPVNFNRESVRYIRYSMPTKVPAYLSSGTPILVYGPPETAQVDYARRAGWAHLVTRRDDDELVNGLRSLVVDASLRERVSNNAKIVAARNHDASRIRAEFQSMLIDSAAVTM